MRKQYGLTFIELFVAIAIIALIAVIGLPAYSKYSARAKVAEGLTIAAPIKMAVIETHHSLNVFPSSNKEAAAQSITTDIVQSINVGANGVVVITYKNSELGYGTFADFTIELTPVLQAEGNIIWDCTGGSMPVSIRPSSCR